MITGVTLAAGQTCTITYGSKAGGCRGGRPQDDGCLHVPGLGGLDVFGDAHAGRGSPVVTIYAANGSGTMTVSPTTLSAGSTGNTLTFTYTAATGGLRSGEVEVAVPTGWPDAPSTIRRLPDTSRRPAELY